MRKSRFSEERILGLLRRPEAGRPVTELCHQVEITGTAFYKWCSKLAGLEVPEVRRHGRAVHPDGVARVGLRRQR